MISLFLNGGLKHFILIQPLIALLMLSGCYIPRPYDSEADKRAKLAILGASAVGFTGYSVVSANTIQPYHPWIVGLVGGGAATFIFKSVYAQLDLLEREKHYNARYEVLSNPKAKKENWNIPSKKTSGAVKETESYINEKGQKCVNLHEQITKDKQTTEGTSTACLVAAGTWVLS